jgi:hypothetical protein
MLFTDETFSINADVYNKIMLLSKEEVSNPQLMLKQFFDYYSLASIREYLYNVKRVTLTTEDDEFIKPKQRSSLIFFLERIEQLVEASSLIAASHQKPITRAKRKTNKKVKNN